MFEDGFFWSLLNILLIDLVLAGDNSLIIAAATKNLGSKIKRWAILFGTITAAILRILFLWLASLFLQLPFLYAVGGAYIIYLAVKIMKEEGSGHATKSEERLLSAIWIIASADALMSLDNVLAVAGVAGGRFWLLVFGVVLSIPIIFTVSSLLSRLMERFPTIVLLGSVVLARVGGKMIGDEKAFARFLWYKASYIIQTLAVVFILFMYFRMRAKKQPV